MSRARLFARMQHEIVQHVRVVDMSPTQWLINHASLTTNRYTMGSKYFNLINSCITNGEQSIIDPQLKSHEFHMDIGCNTLRTFTEYITPSIIANSQKLQNLLKSSVYTGYHSLDEKANTFQGMFGGVRPVEIAATIGPLLRETSNTAALQNEYKQILDILAPSFDILWIQNIHNLVQLQVIMELGKMYKDDEQIWVTVDSTLMSGNGVNQLFDFFLQHSPGSIIVTGSDWKEINKHLVLLQEFTEIEGGTKFGVIVDSKQMIRDRDAGDQHKEEGDEKKRLQIDGQVNELNELWIEHVGGEYVECDEWTDELLEKASRFWIEQGISIIGCEWESGLRVVKKQANAWNDTIGTVSH